MLALRIRLLCKCSWSSVDANPDSFFILFLFLILHRKTTRSYKREADTSCSCGWLLEREDRKGAVRSKLHVKHEWSVHTHGVRDTRDVAARHLVSTSDKHISVPMRIT